MSLRRAAFALGLSVLALAASGCAAGQPFVAEPGEYGVYRKARAAHTLEERLAASWSYLQKYPDGAWADDVRGFFRRAEPLYFASVKTSKGGLEAYLLAMPNGPSSREANMRLRDLRAFANAERSDLAGAAGATDVNVAYEVERRKNVEERIEQWIALFLDPRAFASPMVEATPSVIIPWSLALPWPVCVRADSGPEAPKGPALGARRCSKLLQLDYRAVDGGESQERQALVEVAIWQDEAGRPLEVSIGGPELFLRLDETATARGADASDPEAKLRGAERAVTLANKVFGAQVSADRGCKKTADSDVLKLACKGVELRVLAGALDGDDDRFVVRLAP